MQVECGKFGREAVGLHPHVENLFRPHSFAQRSQRGLYPAAAVALRSLPQSIVREVEIISGKWTRLVRHLMSAKMSRGIESGHGAASWRNVANPSPVSNRKTGGSGRRVHVRVDYGCCRIDKKK